jgi:hypothetical protein
MLNTVLALTAVPVVAALVSGLVAAVRRPRPRLTSGLQHFAAGVVFSAAAIELLPAVLHRSPIVAVLGFAVGKRAAPSGSRSDSRSPPESISSSTGSSSAPTSQRTAPSECC